MLRYNICFHPGWWHKTCGTDFSRRFWEDSAYRMDADREMRRVLYQKFGEYGLGEKDLAPRPLVGSDLTACGFIFSEMLGCEVIYDPANAPQVICAGLDDDAAFGLTAPDFDKSEVWQRQERQLKALADEYGYVECHLNLMGVQNIALDLRGQELLMDYYDEDSPAQHLLDVAYRTMAEGCRRLKRYSRHISGGVTNIVGSVCPDVLVTSNCTVELVSLKIYEDNLLKFDCLLADEFAPFGIHHCGRTMEHVAAGYARVPNLRFAEVGAFSDLKKVSEILPGHVLLNARYSPVRLSQASLSEIKSEVERLAAQVPGRRLSISCVGIDANTPEDNILSFLDACRAALPE